MATDDQIIEVTFSPEGEVVAALEGEALATALAERERFVADQAVREAEEDARRELAAIVAAYLDTLAANETQLVNGIATLKGPNPPSTIAQLRTYVTAMAEMTLDHNRGLDRLIRYLARTGVIGG